MQTAASTESLMLIVNQGLITEALENIDPDARPFARKVKEIERQGLTEEANLVDVVSVLNLQCFFDIGCLNYELS